MQVTHSAQAKLVGETHVACAGLAVWSEEAVISSEYLLRELRAAERDTIREATHSATEQFAQLKPHAGSDPPSHSS